MLAAFLAMFAGLILSNMEKQNRRDFEINRIRLNRNKLSSIFHGTKMSCFQDIFILQPSRRISTVFTPSSGLCLIGFHQIPASSNWFFPDFRLIHIGNTY